MANKLRIAVIGTGWIAGTFKFCQKFVSQTKIVACCDLNEALAKKFAGKQFPYFTNVEDMYQKAEFDILYLATPHYLHRRMIEQALEHGKDVLCEKPISISIDDTKAIIQKAKQLGRKVGVMYQYRYDSNCYKMAKACQAGHLGQLYWGKVEVPWFRAEKYFQQGDWRRSWEKAGGGTLLIHASHSIDILCWAFGKPVSVSGEINTLRQNTEVEDVGSGTIQFENGAIATILGTSLTKPSKLVKIEVCGEKGRLELTRMIEFSSMRWRGVSHYKTKNPSKNWIAFSKAIDGFTRWIQENNAPYLHPVEHSLPVLSVIYGIYESAKQKKKIRIDAEYNLSPL